MKENLSAIIDKARERNVVVDPAPGMEAPPNFGPEYADRSGRRSATSRCRNACCSCRSCSTTWPGKPALNQADGIHPNQQGTRIVADTVWTVLEPLLDQMSGAS